VARGAAVKAFVHSEQSARKLDAIGVAETMVGDFRREADLTAAMKDCSSVFFVAPPFIEDEDEVGRRIVETAQDAGIDHLVYSSVMHPQISRMDHHAKKLRVEEAVIESGLAFNIVQPAMMMQNLRVAWQSITEKGVYPVFSSPEKTLSLIDTEDLGEAIAIVLTDRSLRNAVFELAGPDALSYNQMAELIGNEVGQTVTVYPLSNEERRGVAASQGFSSYATEAFLKMAEHYDEHGFCGGNSLVLSSILGRQPHGFRDVVKRFAA
jgi:uncharacterized protein YbjT (DUF2867 family)